MFKKIVLLMFVFNLAYSNWENISLNPKSINLSDIAEINSILVAVGENGFIKYSEDLGNNWSYFKVDKLSRNLNKIVKHDSTLFVAGNYGCLGTLDLVTKEIKTINIESKGKIIDIAFNKNIGILVVEGESVFISYNSGKSWEKLSLKINNIDYSNQILRSIITKSGKIIFLTVNSLIFSDDNCNNYEKIGFDVDAKLLSIVQNNDNSMIIGTGNKKIYKLDSAMNVINTIQNNLTPQSIYRLYSFNDSILIAGIVHNLDLNHAISYDGGMSWFYANKTGRIFLNGATFLKSELYFVSNMGLIFKYNIDSMKYNSNFDYLGEIIELGDINLRVNMINGSNDKIIISDGFDIYVSKKLDLKWKKIFTNNLQGYYIKDISFIDNDKIIAVVKKEVYQNGSYKYFSKIIEITGDTSYKVLYETPIELNIYKIIFRPNSVVTFFPCYNKILWLNSENKIDSLKIENVKYFVNNSFGLTFDNYYYFIAVDSNNKDILYLTQDFKEIKKQVLSTAINNLVMISKDVGLTHVSVVDKQNILKTTDGGNSFNVVYSFELNNPNIPLINYINFSDLKNGVAAGINGKVFYTDTGGSNWFDISLSKSNGSLIPFYPFANELYVYDGVEAYKFVGMFPNDVRFSDPISFNKGLYLFPNPALSTTRISLLQEGDISISAVDVLGRSFPLWSGFTSAGEMELDVSTLLTGTYTLLINYGTKVEAVRLIKN